jgi:hypothetical protein
MSELLPDCCQPARLSEIGSDLGSSAGFEFELFTCLSCGAAWLRVFCGHSQQTGLEPMSPADARAVLALSTNSERKNFMRRWADEHL